MNSKTVVINVFGEPSAGKSVLSARIFTLLKCIGYNVEYLQEFAKQKLYEHADKVFTCEPYIFAKQLFRQQVISDDVDIVVTDSPILLPPFYEYNEKKKKILFDLALYYFYDFNNINIFCKRTHKYQNEGRFQTEEESNIISKNIMNFLIEQHIPFDIMPSNITDEQLLEWLKKELDFNDDD